MKACVEPCGERKEYLISCTAHACRTCTGPPPVLTAGTTLHARFAEPVLRQRPTEFLNGYLCRELIQAHRPWPAGRAGGGRARPHAALRCVPLERLQAAGACCHKAACSCSAQRGAACCVFGRPAARSPGQPHTGCSGVRSARASSQRLQEHYQQRCILTGCRGAFRNVTATCSSSYSPGASVLKPLQASECSAGLLKRGHLDAGAQVWQQRQ